MTDPSTQPVVAPSAFARARAALRDRLSTWWAETNLKWPVAWIVCVAALLIIFALPAVRSITSGPAHRPAVDQLAAVQADQTHTLAELVDRVYALDLLIVDLQDQVSKLQEPKSTAAPLPGARRVSGASQNRLPSQAQESKRWGTTDLDREIEAFTRSLNQPEQAK